MLGRLVCLAILLYCSLSSDVATGGELEITVVDSESKRPVAVRVYCTNQNGESFFAKSTSKNGSAIPYTEEWVPMPASEELHTTVSAHPFRFELPAGEYKLTFERGKEWLPKTIEVKLDDKPQLKRIELSRLANLASRGWYSGETHVHRRIHELPNVMEAEDLHVAFPVTFWTTRSDAAPNLEPSSLRSQGPSPLGPREDRGYDPIRLDGNRFIVPRNTEYEIFSVGNTRHTLGAVFLLNHRTPFTKLAPPIRPIAEQAHAEGALLDLDKHSWPWSVMLVPIAKVDLFELSNNSVWRTKFGFNQLPANLPEWMEVEKDSPTTLTEWGWLQYGFQMYYAFLNCGFDIMPTAGTASGVHPVPLGYSRVYVQVEGELTPEKWLKGLREGRSFVTTGPLLTATVSQVDPKDRAWYASKGDNHELNFECFTETDSVSVEHVVNGHVNVLKGLKPTQLPNGGYRTSLKMPVRIAESRWMALRVIEQLPDGKKRFAHTAPWHFKLPGSSVSPRAREVDYFIQLIEAELERNKNVLDVKSLAEFEEARRIYQSLRERAK